MKGWPDWEWRREKTELPGREDFFRGVGWCASNGQQQREKGRYTQDIGKHLEDRTRERVCVVTLARHLSLSTLSFRRPGKRSPVMKAAFSGYIAHTHPAKYSSSSLYVHCTAPGGKICKLTFYRKQKFYALVRDLNRVLKFCRSAHSNVKVQFDCSFHVLFSVYCYRHYYYCT